MQEMSTGACGEAAGRSSIDFRQKVSGNGVDRCLWRRGWQVLVMFLERAYAGSVDGCLRRSGWEVFEIISTKVLRPWCRQVPAAQRLGRLLYRLDRSAQTVMSTDLQGQEARHCIIAPLHESHCSVERSLICTFQISNRTQLSQASRFIRTFLTLSCCMIALTPSDALSFP